MKFRYRAFLRNTSNISATGRLMINIPKDVWEEAGWKINELIELKPILQENPSFKIKK